MIATEELRFRCQDKVVEVGGFLVPRLTVTKASQLGV